MPHDWLHIIPARRCALKLFKSFPALNSIRTACEWRSFRKPTFGAIEFQSQSSGRLRQEPITVGFSGDLWQVQMHKVCLRILKLVAEWEAKIPHPPDSDGIFCLSKNNIIKLWELIKIQFRLIPSGRSAWGLELSLSFLLRFSTFSIWNLNEQEEEKLLELHCFLYNWKFKFFRAANPSRTIGKFVNIKDSSTTDAKVKWRRNEN